LQLTSKSIEDNQLKRAGLSIMFAYLKETRKFKVPHLSGIGAEDLRSGWYETLVLLMAPAGALKYLITFATLD
jgi:hypothetical protein